MAKDEFVPYIPPEKVIPEFSVKAIGLGILLAIVMGAANAYLGLYAGMTVSASIPAAVISMAIMRARFLRGNILENNMVKTSAAAGEALAAGVIFTIPALIIIYEMTNGNAGWADLTLEGAEGTGQYMVITAAALIGGVLGVLFTIPLRKILIVDLDLPYPEGVACTEVLKAGDKGGKGLTTVFFALIVGLLYKFAGSRFGLRLWEERLVGVANPEGDQRIMFGSDLSPALLGVGYIIGPKISLMVFSGGVLGWLILIPLIGGVNGYTAPGLDGIELIWKSETMYVGIGAIITGGLYTLFKMRGPIKTGISQSMAGLKVKKADIIRTERDFPFNLWFLVIIAALMAGFYWYVTEDPIVVGVSTVLMFVFAFFFTAVAGYIAGVVGSSNNPISGVTVATLMFTALVLVGAIAIGAGITNNAGMTATILVAAIVCCSAAIAGDCMQELKTGQLLGSTPRNLQLAEFVGAICSAFFLAPIVIYLHQAYTIGSIDLPAPQAKVMASVVVGVFTGQMNIPMLLLGIGIAFLFIFLEYAKIARISIMAVAIGIYLPLTLTVPIFLGGVIKALVFSFTQKKVQFENRGKPIVHLEKKVTEELEEADNKGILIASGLVAGEALMGVIIATLVVIGLKLTVIPGPIAWPGLLIFLYIGFLLAYLAIRERIGHLSFGQVRRILGPALRDIFKEWKR